MVVGWRLLVVVVVVVVVIPQTVQNDPWCWEKVETSVDRLCKIIRSGAERTGR